MPRSRPAPPRRPPSPPKRRAETAAETREALIAAGLELFGAHGLDAPSLDAICAHAGKTRGAFYVHFADRDAFLEAVMARAGEDYLAGVVGAGDTPLDLGVIVARFLASIATGAYPLTRPGGPRPHQLLDACARSPAVRARYVALVEQTIGRVRDALAASAPRPELDPDVAARVLRATVIGAQTMLERGVRLDVPRAARELVRLLTARPEAPPPARASRRPRAPRRGSP
ncbi:MAG: TetR/AcrR family transcriptional regulator [Deltaproteobacteria bacterium]|nr:TetR/AcrR family transcriptional regulator [Deltaproteobacteria bacterium]